MALIQEAHAERSASRLGLLLGTLLALGLIATLGGSLAPVWPMADAFNHVRPFALAGSGGLLVVSWLLGHRSIAGAALALVLINALAIAPAALTAARPMTAEVAAQPRLTLATFNMWTQNARRDEAAIWLERQNADVVILQEMNRANRDAVLARLSSQYPHVHAFGCGGLVVFSKHPWSSLECLDRTEERPNIVRFGLDLGGGKSVTVVGIHTSYPLKADQQARQYRWLERWLPELQGPLVVAGDFNATPWSYGLGRLQLATGLVRHGTLAASWSARLPVPLFLIDNVLSSAGLRTVSFRSGPDLGSDHLPVVAELVFD